MDTEFMQIPENGQPINALLYSEMEEDLKYLAAASTAGDHNHACDFARSVLERKKPEAMKPQERRLAMDLCYEIGDHALMEVLRRLDNQ